MIGESDGRYTGAAEMLEKKIAAADAVNIQRAQREPRWGELGLERKVEILRSTLLQLEAMLTHTQSGAKRALEIAKAHSHNPNGEVLVPVMERTLYLNEPGGWDLRHLFAGLR